MAFCSQENKAEKLALLKTIIPGSWRWTLAVHDHSELVLTIREAPVNLITANNIVMRRTNVLMPTSHHLNQYHVRNEYSGELGDLFQKIADAMFKGNHNNSRPEIDHHDVGWYVTINIGDYKSPFKYNPLRKDPKAFDRVKEMAQMKAKIAKLEAALGVKL